MNEITITKEEFMEKISEAIGEELSGIMAQIEDELDEKMSTQGFKHMVLFTAMLMDVCTRALFDEQPAKKYEA